MDYNTAFGDQVGWQAYPKVGLSYVMSDEPWMSNLVYEGWVNSLKFMANYGVAGSYPPAFEYQRTIEVSSYLDKQANTFGKNGNPNLGPERKHSYEIGFQGTFLHNVLSLGLTYYCAITRDALFNVPTLPSSGQSSSYLANIGRIRNQGFEFYAGVTVTRSAFPGKQKHHGKRKRYEQQTNGQDRCNRKFSSVLIRLCRRRNNTVGRIYWFCTL